MKANAQQYLWRVLALSLVVGAGLLAGYYFGVHLPEEQAQAQLNSEVETSQRHLQQNLAELEEADDTDATATCQQWDRARSDLPGESERTAFRFAVEEMARQARVQLEGLRWRTMEAEGPVGQARMSFDITGDPDDVAQFVQYLEEYRRPSRIVALDLNVDGDERDLERRRDISAQMNVTLRVLESGVAAAQLDTCRQ